MGGTVSTSADVGAALPSDEGAPQQGRTATKLFKWVPAGRGGCWELAAANAGIRVYDANEDSETRKAEWHLEVEGSQEAPDSVVDDSFEFEATENRCSFFAEGTAWALQFPTPAAFEQFCQRYNKAVFENTFGVEQTEENVAKVAGDFLIKRGGESQTSRDEWVVGMDVDAPAPRELATPRRQREASRRESAVLGVVMGAGARSYVVREGQMDVMRNVQGGLEDTGTNFSFAFQTPGRAPRGAGAGTPVLGGGGTTPGGRGSTPTKALLMDQESRMNMLTPGSTSIYHASIETGQVVNEFTFEKDGVAVPMRDIASVSKAAQVDGGQTFLSLDPNRLAMWDMRDPRGVVAEMASPPALAYIGGKDYARGTKFSCMATSGEGYVVVGAEDGKVRLYNERTLTQAKTTIPGLGAPVTAVDVTFDGKWVLSTTRSYLMVVKTTYKVGDSGQELCGFTSRMGAAAPAPRLLRLRPADVAAVGGAPLEKGHFTWVTEAGRQERWIVASCGNFTVLWNFRAVKQASPDVTSMGGLTTVTQYHLIPKQEHVVDSVFMHDNFSRSNESAMVVATKQAVYTGVDEDEEDEEEEEEARGRRRWGLR